MKVQPLFRSDFVDTWRENLKRNKRIESYLTDEFAYSAEHIIYNPRIAAGDVVLLDPSKDSRKDFENAKLIFEAYKTLSSTQATDHRFWVYLAHVPFWKYMQKRYPVSEQERDKRGKYILEHWYIDGTSPQHFVRHGVALLWWGAKLTYDESLADPYSLTRELFSMLDYTRTLLPGTQGRNQNFTRALLEFVLENREVFASYKEGKIRFLMRQVNYVGAYKILPSLAKEEIKQLFSSHLKSLREQDFARKS